MQSAFCRQAKKNGRSRHANTATEIPSRSEGAPCAKEKTRPALRSSSSAHDTRVAARRSSQSLRFQGAAVPRVSASWSSTSTDRFQRGDEHGSQPSYVGHVGHSGSHLGSRLPYSQIQTQPFHLTGQPPAHPSYQQGFHTYQSSQGSNFHHPGVRPPLSPQGAVSFQNNVMVGFNQMSQLTCSQDTGSQGPCFSQGSTQRSTQEQRCHYPSSQQSRMMPTRETPSVFADNDPLKSHVEPSRRMQKSQLLEIAGYGSSNIPQPWNRTNGGASQCSTKSGSKSSLGDMRNVLRPLPESKMPLTQAMQTKLQAFVRCEVKKLMQTQHDSCIETVQEAAASKVDEYIEGKNKLFDAKVAHEIERLANLRTENDDHFRDVCKEAASNVDEHIKEKNKLFDTKVAEAMELHAKLRTESKDHLRRVCEEAKEELLQEVHSAKDEALELVSNATTTTLKKIAAAGTHLVQTIIPKINKHVGGIMETIKGDRPRAPCREKTPSPKTLAKDTDCLHHRAQREIKGETIEKTEMVGSSRDTSKKKTTRKRNLAPTKSTVTQKRAKISALTPLEIVQIESSPSNRVRIAESPTSTTVSISSEEHERIKKKEKQFLSQGTRSRRNMSKASKCKGQKGVHVSHLQGFQDISGFL